MSQTGTGNPYVTLVVVLITCHVLVMSVTQTVCSHFIYVWRC